MGKIAIPGKVYTELDMLKRSGNVDLHNYKDTLQAARDMGLKAAENWLADNMKIYMQGMVYGMEPTEEDVVYLSNQ